MWLKSSKTDGKPIVTVPSVLLLSNLNLVLGYGAELWASMQKDAAVRSLPSLQSPAPWQVTSGLHPPAVPSKGLSFPGTKALSLSLVFLYQRGCFLSSSRSHHRSACNPVLGDFSFSFSSWVFLLFSSQNIKPLIPCPIRQSSLISSVGPGIEIKDLSREGACHLAWFPPWASQP